MILAPISQVGCLSASAGETSARSLHVLSLNAPPEAVMNNFLTGESSPCMHCQIADGSLSTGRISPPFSRAARISNSPAITTGSLFASASRFPARSAARAGPIPAQPDVAPTTRSTSGSEAISAGSASFAPLKVPLAAVEW